LVAVPSEGRATLVEAPRVAPEAAATHGLYERHAAKILSYCQHQLGSREEAEDAVQTTFMNAFRALGKGIVPESETAWLFKIAENVCLSRRRSSWRRNRIESPSDFEVIEEIVPGPSRQQDELIGIEDALASMPEQQRRAILLREWQGLSYREISAELELSQSAVETLIFRARRSLAQGLEQPETLKAAKPRKNLRRALHAADAGALLASLKTLFTGALAVKATAAAVAVTAATGAAVAVKPHEHAKPTTAPAPVRAAALPAKASVSSPLIRSVAAPVVEEGVQPEAREPTRRQPSPARRPLAEKAKPVVAPAPEVAAPVVEVSVAEPPAVEQPVAEQPPPPVAYAPKPKPAQTARVEKSKSDPPAAQDPPGRALGYEKAKSRKDERRQTSASPAPVDLMPESELSLDAAPAVEPDPAAAEHGKREDKGKHK
jgi:RNA polymerase sigma factor (sigma-70 family)